MCALGLLEVVQLEAALRTLEHRLNEHAPSWRCDPLVLSFRGRWTRPTSSFSLDKGLRLGLS